MFAAFGALTLLVGQQEGYPACRKLSGEVLVWLFPYGPANATTTPSSLAPVKSRMVYLSGAGLPRLSGKRPLNGCSNDSYRRYMLV